MTDFLGVIQLIGFVFALTCLLVGMYVVLRWGFCGVALLWGQRHIIDIDVREDAKGRWGR